MQREWARIRDLEAKLGRAHKAEQEMAAKMHQHRLRIEEQLNKADILEEEKREVSKAYDKKNRRGLTSQISATEKKKSGAAGKPPVVQSGKAIFKTKREMAQEAEARMFEKMAGGGGAGASDTFLTGLAKKKPARSASKRGAGSEIDGRSSVADSEMNAADIEEELRDVVFDYE